MPHWPVKISFVSFHTASHRFEGVTRLSLYYLAHEREKTNQQVPREQTNGPTAAMKGF